MKYNKLISWIIPCFNEQEVLEISIQRIIDCSSFSSHYNWEFIFVDDGSKDNTREIIKSYNLQDDRVKLVGLSRNFGHQYAVQAGSNNAYGDAAIIIDAICKILQRLLKK